MIGASNISSLRWYGQLTKNKGYHELYPLLLVQMNGVFIIIWGTNLGGYLLLGGMGLWSIGIEIVINWLCNIFHPNFDVFRSSVDVHAFLVDAKDSSDPFLCNQKVNSIQNGVPNLPSDMFFFLIRVWSSHDLEWLG